MCTDSAARNSYQVSVEVVTALDIGVSRGKKGGGGGGEPLKKIGYYDMQLCVFNMSMILTT